MLNITTHARPGLRIGRYVSLSYTARWGIDHPMDRLSTSSMFYADSWGDTALPPEAPALVIEPDAWVGDNVVITGGCRRIGLGAVIGAGAVVTRDVPDFAIVVGMPGRVVRHRFDPATQDLIRASRWWELDPDQLSSFIDVFRQPADPARLAEALRGLQALHAPG